MEEIKNEPIKNEPIKVKRPRRTKIQMMVDRQAKTELLHQKFLEASKETIIPTEYPLLRKTEKAITALTSHVPGTCPQRFPHRGLKTFVLNFCSPYPETV